VSKNNGGAQAAAIAPEKEKALAAAMSQIDRKYGKGSIMKMGEASSRLAIEVIPTGAISLDIALGVGGLPRGRVVEIFGPYSSGKTTLAQHIIAEAQKMGGVAAFIDAEHAFDVQYAARCGVDTTNLLVSQPDFGEQALEICEMVVRSNAVDVVVIDSVAALVPRAEIEGDMGDSLPGLQARLMSQALRKLSGAINKSKTVVIFLNQIRMKIGVMFGSPETTTGGEALKFYSSVRLDIRRIETLKSGQEAIGSRSRVKVIKNKVAPPFRQAEFDIMNNEGISRVGNILDIATEMSVIRKSGAWFYLGDDRLGQGRENAKNFLNENPALADEIERLIRAQAVTTPAAAAPVAAEEEDEDGLFEE
jgi:recombination protein RecA